jgi:glycosyltransferase involved in cell wall biosynthesis
MSYGLPVVAFNKGGPAEIINDGVHGILLGENDNLAEKLTPLFVDAALRTRLGDAGRKRAEDFSLARHVQNMREVFASVIKQEEL